MRNLNELIMPYYEDVPLEDDYLSQVPEFVMLDDVVSQEESDPHIKARTSIEKEQSKLDADVLIVGAGITGMQAALDIADKGYRVLLIDKTSTIGGNMVKLDKTFPTNDCSICTAAPKMVEISRHPNIRLMTYAEIMSLDGEAGNFTAHIYRKSKYVDPDKCTGCDDCVPVCPVEVVNTFDEKLHNRKAIYIEFPQAVPIVYTIDYEHCVGCGACERVCEAGAISFLEKSDDIEVKVGSVIVATGFELFEPTEMRKEYGYGKYKNVITAMQLERLLSSFGPTEGKVLRPSDGKKPKSIGWIQCVGSRSKQQGFPYCSRVCCMYATKEASIIKESVPDTDVTIFYMDLRAYGKDFQQYYDKAKANGVEYVRSRPSSVYENDDGGITVRFMDTHTREVQERSYDLLVLSTAIMPSTANPKLAGVLDIDIDENGFFCADDIMTAPTESTRKGVYIAGCNQGPKDIPDSVAMGSGAAAKAVEVVVDREKAPPPEEVPERDVSSDRPSIGVFVCHCGKNIHGFLDTDKVAEYAKELPYVDFATDVLFACSEDTQKEIRKKMTDEGLNRLIIAACSPVTHGPLFQDTVKEAGLNKYLFEFANIRQHCSWVHSHNREEATQKAKDLVRIAAAKSAKLEPLTEEEVDVEPRVLVVGGGLSGMRAALSLSEMNIKSYLVDTDPELGGILKYLHSLFPSDIDPADVIQPLIEKVRASDKIEVLTGTELIGVEGFIGNFKGKVKTNGEERELEFGTVILATGFDEISVEDMYCFGKSDRVITQKQLEAQLRDWTIHQPKKVVMINCVGAMEEERPYCCRIGCGVSIKNAKMLKDRFPKSDIYILYRDIRVFGKDEEEYFASVIEEDGVKIVRYSAEQKPDVSIGDDGNVKITVHDQVYNDDISIDADLLVLTANTEGTRSANALVEMFKVPVGSGNFFMEAHVKIRPLDFATDGIYFCGSAHFPKNLADTIAQAEGAASRAAIPIMKGRLVLEGTTAEVTENLCVGCGLCVEACPFSAIELENGKAVVNAALCKGCGLCSATCRSGAIQQKGFKDGQILCMIKAALNEVY